MAHAPIIRELNDHMADNTRHGDIAAHNVAADAHENRFSGVNQALDIISARVGNAEGSTGAVNSRVDGLANTVTGLADAVSALQGRPVSTMSVATGNIFSLPEKSGYYTLPDVGANNVYFWVISESWPSSNGGEGGESYDAGSGSHSGTAKTLYFVPRSRSSSYSGTYIVFGWS